MGSWQLKACQSYYQESIESVYFVSREGLDLCILFFSFSVNNSFIRPWSDPLRFFRSCLDFDSDHLSHIKRKHNPYLAWHLAPLSRERPLVS